jgi:ribosomal protein L40E
VSDAATNGADDLGFLDRARLRRRLRHLEQVKELGLRDVGGLQFELHRAGTSNKKLVDAKLKALKETDDELRALRTALDADTAVVELRETGIVACQNCGALVGSDAKFCSACGTPTSSK